MHSSLCIVYGAFHKNTFPKVVFHTKSTFGKVIFVPICTFGKVFMPISSTTDFNRLPMVARSSQVQAVSLSFGNRQPRSSASALFPARPKWW